VLEKSWWDLLWKLCIVYKWLLLVSWADRVQAQSNFRTLPTNRWSSCTDGRWIAYLQGAGRVSLTVASHTQKELNNHNLFKSCHLLRATKCAGSANPIWTDEIRFHKLIWNRDLYSQGQDNFSSSVNTDLSELGNK